MSSDITARYCVFYCHFNVFPYTHLHLFLKNTITTREIMNITTKLALIVTIAAGTGTLAHGAASAQGAASTARGAETRRTVAEWDTIVASIIEAEERQEERARERQKLRRLIKAVEERTFEGCIVIGLTDATEKSQMAEQKSGPANPPANPIEALQKLASIPTATVSTDPLVALHRLGTAVPAPIDPIAALRLLGAAAAAAGNSAQTALVQQQQN
jgi:hypothetical protein